MLFIDDNNHKKVNIDGTETELSIMEKFNDAISFMINASLHASDDLDSDNDGLLDCDELYGMPGRILDIIWTNPHDADCDKDGLSDGEEMLRSTINDKYIKKIFGRLSEEQTDLSRLLKKHFYVFEMSSDPRLVDSDGDGYLDNGRTNDGVYKDPNPLDNGIRIYEINDFEQYVPVIDDISNYQYYGGSQNWFGVTNPTVMDTDQIIREDGCGLIAAVNIILYWALQKLEYNGDMLKIIPQIMNGIIKKSEFITFVRWMNFCYFNTLQDLGVIGPLLDTGLNLYCSENDIPIKSRWKALYGDNLLDSIRKMLRKSNPVIFAIGPKSNKKIFFYDWSSVINLSDPHQFQFTVDRIDTDGDTIEDSDYSIDGHYMTITRLIIDNEFDARWLQVQTWGRVQYINFDEWMTGMGPHGFNGIIFMERK